MISICFLCNSYVREKEKCYKNFLNNNLLNGFEFRSQNMEIFYLIHILRPFSKQKIKSFTKSKNLFQNFFENIQKHSLKE